MVTRHSDNQEARKATTDSILRYAQVLDPNKVIYLIVMFFLFAGLFVALVFDIQDGYPAVFIGDFVTLAAFSLSMWLYFTKRWRSGAALSLAIVFAVAVNVLSFFVQADLYRNEPARVLGIAENTHLLMPLILGLSSGLGLAVNRLWVLPMLVVAMAVLVFDLLFLPNDLQLFSLKVNYVLGFLFSSLAVFSFRRRLVLTANQLGSETEKHRVLKAKADEYYELHRPFVRFGQNTSALAEDFQDSIDRISQQLAEIEGSEAPSLSAIEEASSEVDIILRRIEWIRMTTSARRDAPAENLNVAELIQGSAYASALSMPERKKIAFVLEFDPNYRLRQKKAPFVRLIETVFALQYQEQALLHRNSNAAWTLALQVSDRQQAGCLLSFPVQTTRSSEYQACLHALSEVRGRFDGSRRLMGLASSQTSVDFFIPALAPQAKEQEAVHARG